MTVAPAPQQWGGRLRHRQFQRLMGTSTVTITLRALALGHDVSRARFTLATLGSHTQIELDIVERCTDHSVADDDFVADALADTDNHGMRTVGCFIE
jgi:hypothetical protein